MYAGQIVVLTYPQIGNYGANSGDNEAVKPFIEGLVVGEFSPLASNWRSQEEADQFLTQYNVPIISEIDTRRLVRHLRTRGVMRGVLSTVGGDPAALVERARTSPSMAGLDLASRVTTPKGYEWATGVEPVSPSDRMAGEQAPDLHVVAYDFGIKRTSCGNWCNRERT